MYGLGGIGDNKQKDYRGQRLRGKVVDNDDPEKCRRLKISVPELYGEAGAEDLPWAIPNPVNSVGNTADCGSFGVPIIDSWVYITLDDGDPNTPIWVGMPAMPSTRKALEEVNYPNRYGMVDEKGNHWFVDRQTGDWEIYHHSGTKFLINDTGTLTVEVVEDQDVHVVGNLTAQVDGTADITVDGNTNVNVGGNLNCQVSGSATIQAGGNATLQGADVSIIGATIACTGNVTVSGTLIAQGTVIGAGKNLATHTHGGVSTGGGQTGQPT